MKLLSSKRKKYNDAFLLFKMFHSGLPKPPRMEEEDAYVKAHLPPPTVKKRTLEELAERKNEQKKARIKQVFFLVLSVFFCLET